MSIIILFLMNALLAIVTAVGMTIAPFLLVENLGVSLVLLGVIEGILEMSSSLVKLLSGIVFDRIKKVKNLFLLSALISLSSKILLFFPTTLNIVLSKGFERISNGMFATPRDAYILENTSNRGFSYGLLNSSKTIGCIIGSMLVSIIVYMSGLSLENNLQVILYICCGTAVLAAFISLFIKNSNVSKSTNENAFKPYVIKNQLLICLRNKDMQIKLLPIYISAFLFFLGRYNDGMLMFYLKDDICVPSWLYLSTISIFNTAMFIIAPIFGKLIDKNYARGVLVLTIISLVLFNIVFINLLILPDIFVFIGLALWGIQRTGASIIFAYLLFQRVEDKSIYGTNLGILMFLIGISTLIGSVIAGNLISIDFKYVFMFSTFCSLLSYTVSRYIK